MINLCIEHFKKHQSFRWKSWVENGKVVYECRDRVLGKSIFKKIEDRKSHWKEIKTRITTPEGEILNGVKGERYRQRYIGQNIPVNFDHPSYQKELARTG